MSQSLAIVCDQCDRYLVVGKSSSDGWYIHSDADVQAQLSLFVDGHYGHPTRFIDLDRVSAGYEDQSEFDRAAVLDKTMPAVLNQVIDYVNPCNGAWESGKVRRISIAGGPEQWLIWAEDNQLIPMVDVEQWRPKPDS